ncbi:DUF3570 domain-containing protein [Psychroflexus planctonicus]|uniref:DUF3570 domain-containing protein n=1 Tax=Psychroflexus planctonicus TaxID=1526575 RepID=A0ABQ1SDX1_9FLAO|nr:DUF3570 domain-containing protein [Psychroflexus planctonicus]GGE30751.1 hypothetical protein GCM10010832_08970 [Psychroflexus planctonicus]
MKNILFLGVCFLLAQNTYCQNDKTSEYKKRVLESTEVNLLSSYYSQDGENAAVTGGRGTEELTDFAPSINVAIPLNEDDVLAIDATVSAYTSASSSNIDPFDGDQPADPFVASTGASRQDTWFGLTANYSHSSDDRNTIISGNLSFANEYDYTSFGFGGSLTKLFNQKNTELQLKANVFFDTWNPQYPIEFRNSFTISDYDFEGESNFASGYTEFSTLNRNSYSLGINFSQILTKNIQTAFMADFVMQDGLLSTPHQRVYFADIADTVIENFVIGNDIERLPDSHLKIALGNRTNFYLNENFILRTYYRYYTDDWGIDSHTFKMEVPVKVGLKYALYPMYRYYTQTQADAFGAYNSLLSTQEFYTSDYDLASYDAHQYGVGFKYYDPLSKFNLGGFGLKSINIEYNYYNRTSQNFTAHITSLSFNFVAD